MLKSQGLLSSPGAALAADGAGGAVTLLHNHADVGFHELRHVHHLPGEAESAGAHWSALGQQIQPNHQKPSEQKPPACCANPWLKFRMKPNVYQLLLIARQGEGEVWLFQMVGAT